MNWIHFYIGDTKMLKTLDQLQTEVITTSIRCWVLDLHRHSCLTQAPARTFAVSDYSLVKEHRSGLAS